MTIWRPALLLCIILLSVSVVVLLPAIPQDRDYHDFIDERVVWGVPNFWNVVSNAPLVWIGMMGLGHLRRKPGPAIEPAVSFAYPLFFTGIALIGLGSAYYHLQPSNGTLVWDRLPMAVAFMAFFTIVLAEFVSADIGQRLFLPLVLVGVFSVAYWHWTELAGKGDLRPYALVQFLPMLLMPLLLLLYPPRFSHRCLLWAVLAAYCCAKAAEVGDEFAYRISGGLSGHTAKHLLAALGAYFFLMALKRRVPLPAADRDKEPQENK